MADSSRSIVDRVFLGMAGHGRASALTLDLVDVCAGAARRERRNLALPGLAMLLFVSFLLMFRVAASGKSADGFGVQFGRIFIFDYMIFVLAWVSGWNMARRWRTNSEMVEELSLSGARPSDIFSAMNAGALAVWFPLVWMLVPVELMIIFFRQRPNVPGGWIEGLAWMVAYAPGVVAMAWFHFATVRLAHAMFAQGAMPRMKLGALAAGNMVLITMLVGFLSAVGCVVTGVVMLAVAGTSEVVLILEPRFRPHFKSEAGVELGWLLASIPAFVVVGWLKSSLSATYSQRFQGLWLSYQWWGAGEVEHPRVYPSAFSRAATLWLRHYAEEEKKGAAPGK